MIGLLICLTDAGCCVARGRFDPVSLTVESEGIPVRVVAGPPGVFLSSVAGSVAIAPLTPRTKTAVDCSKCGGKKKPLNIFRFGYQVQLASAYYRRVPRHMHY